MFWRLPARLITSGPAFALGALVELLLFLRRAAVRRYSRRPATRG